MLIKCNSVSLQLWIGRRVSFYFSLLSWTLQPAARSTVSSTSRSARSKRTTKLTSSLRFPPLRSALSCATMTGLALRSLILEPRVILLTKPVSSSLLVGKDDPAQIASLVQTRPTALALSSLKVTWMGPTWLTSLALSQTNLLARSCVRQITCVQYTPFMALVTKSIQMSAFF